MQGFFGKDTEFFNIKMCIRAANVDVERCMDYAEAQACDLCFEDLKAFPCDMNEQA